MKITRKEAAKWLIDNPKRKFRYTNSDIEVYFNDSGEMVTSNGYPFQIFESDSIFEPVRQLKKMCFGEAMWYYDTKDIYENDLTSVITGNTYFADGLTSDGLTLEEYKGLWTVEGVYEEN